ncbi:MAG: ATP-binding protein [Candidatus Binatia bacterium]
MNQALREAVQSLQKRSEEYDKIQRELRAKETEINALTSQLEEETRARKAAAETQRRQAELLDLTHDAIFIRDFSTGRIGFWNRGSSQLYGWSVEEALGKISHELLKTRFPVSLQEIKTNLETHGRWDGGVIHTAKDGSQFDVESRWSLRRDSDGNPSDILELNYGVSAKRDAEKRARGSETLATLRTTAALFAHEFANSLNGISASLQLLDMKAQEQSFWDSETKSLFGASTDEIKRLGHLLQDFRAFARPQKYNFEAVDLLHLVDEVVTAEKLLYDSSAIEVKREFPDALSAVIIDREKIKQAILNICKNAVEAMPSGGILTLRGYASERTIFLEIDDTGSGIPKGLDVLQPFRSTKPLSSGLGLPIVGQIIAAHNGTVNYVSHPGQGTTFRIGLPAAGV